MRRLFDFARFHSEHPKELQVGQSVFAIGNPFGLDQSLTTGAISALGREIDSVTRRSLQGVIQTDAAINPEIPVDRYSTARDA